MELTEEKVYEVLGVQPEEPPAERGEKEQEPAEPAAQERDDAVVEESGKKHPEGTLSAAKPPRAQEVADPAAAEEAEAANGEDTPPEGPENQPAEQTPEERREAAAARRRAEQKAAIDEAVQKALQEEKERAKGEMAAFFKRAQLKNTITGEPITTMEEFEAWDKAFSEAKLQRDLKAGKLTPEALEKVLAENPAVKQAQELIRKQEEAARAAEETAAKARIDAELLEIRKLDPTIQSMEDLLHMSTAKEFYSLVRKGNSFLDAFRLANMDQLTARAAEAAKQQAQNLTRSKDHLTATGGQRGGGAVSVPADEMKLFREMNPGASEAEIQAYYNKYRGQ